MEIYSSWYLLVHTQQWKQRNNVWNKFKVNNKDIRTTSGVFIANFEHILHIALVFPLLPLNK